MKYLLAVLIMTIAIVSCNEQSRESKFSESYKEIKDFLYESKISETDIIYFYTDTPATTIPNVYCFNAAKEEVPSAPQCFQYIKEYIQLINDSVPPLKKDGILLDSFLKKTRLVDVYDSIVTAKQLNGYDYYLLIDFISFPEPSLQQTLYLAKESVRTSKKRIKLFLVHVISTHNKSKLKQTRISFTTGGRMKSDTSEIDKK
jgi:hypothetical protein